VGKVGTQVGGFGTRPYGVAIFCQYGSDSWIVCEVDEDVDIAKWTCGWIWIEITQERPTFEDDEIEVILL